MNIRNTPAKTLGWKASLPWLILAIASFQAAYTSNHPAARLLIFGYALGLIQLTNQPSVRRAFYFGLAASFLCYAPQLYFFWNIFGPAAIVLWLILAFWVGVFAAIICGSIRRWGKAKAAWLIPVIWTGIEYFRSELYYLKFSWLNVGYAMPFGNGLLGMYGVGFLVFAITAAYLVSRWLTVTIWLLILTILFVLFVPAYPSSHRLKLPTLVGIQMEFPPAGVITKILDQALVKHTNAPIFVLSEYTLDGPPTDALKNWCRAHSRYLVVGGKDPVDTNNFYDTAFVIGTNGEVLFKQAKSVPIQFFRDGQPATGQKLWDSPWGRIGICICYDLSYTRVTDELVRQGAQLLIVPTMDVESWGRHEHGLHALVAPVRAAEYGIPIFRVASSGISQAVQATGQVVARTCMPGAGEIFAAQLRLPARGSLPLDRWLAPLCTGVAGIVTVILLFLAWNERPGKTKHFNNNNRKNAKIGI